MSTIQENTVTFTGSFAEEVSEPENVYATKEEFTEHLTENNPHNLAAADINAAEAIHAHTEADITDLDKYTKAEITTKLFTKVDSSKVLTDVPANAVFTDTVYDDSNVLKTSDALSTVTEENKLITQSDMAASSNGDMQKSVYDTTNSGIVDNAEKVNGLTVEAAVPNNAVFTDTVYDDSTTTKQGNTFNGNSQLVKLDVNGALPAVDGSNLTGIGTDISNLALKAQDINTETAYADSTTSTLYKMYVENGLITLEEL